MKLLYILNVANRVNNFSFTSIVAAKELGFEFDIAGNWSYSSDDERIADEEKYGIKIHQIDFIRSPFHMGNIKAYKQLKGLVKKERYDIIHCNTPIGGLLGRMAGKKYKVPIVIYQAHGFHFYKGAPKRNRLLYYSVEKWLAHYTDALITINSEDYELAKNKFRLRKGGKVYYVHGVGIDMSQFGTPTSKKNTIRNELGINSDDYVLVSAGRLDPNKNNETLIKSLSQVADKKVKLLLCGDGEQLDYLKKVAEKYGVFNRVIFAGKRSDMVDVYHSANALVLASYREGLSRTIMEAMASGLPCVVSKIRGNVDLIGDGENGFLCNPNSPEDYAEAIDKLSNDGALNEKIRQNNLEKIKNFDVSVVEDELADIYKTFM